MEQEYKEGAYCDFVGAFGKVYTLSDEAGNVFYIGSTFRSLEERLAGHIYEAQKGHLGSRVKNEFIRSLDFKIVATIVEMKWATGRKIKHMRPVIEVLEKEWIRKYRELGYNLLNRHTRTGPKYKRPPNEYVGMILNSSVPQ